MRMNGNRRPDAPYPLSAGAPDEGAAAIADDRAENYDDVNDSRSSRSWPARKPAASITVSSGTGTPRLPTNTETKMPR